MRRLVLSGLLCWMLVGSAGGQDVVVNEYFNSGTVGNEYIELLVLTDKLDLRGYQVRDFVATGMNAGEVDGTVTFSNDALWACVRSGSIIVINFRDGVSGDVSFSDGIVVIGEQDSQYFSTTGTPTIARSQDGVEIIDDAGTHVHGLTHGNSIPGGSPLDAAGTTSPSATVSGTSTSNNVVRFFNTDEVADFDNDANAQHSTTQTKGAANDATEEAFRAKQLPIWINEIDAERNLPGTADGQEFIELVGPLGFDITGYQIEIFSCSAGVNMLTSSETITSFAFPDDPGVDKWGFFVIGGLTLFDSNVDQVFSGSGTDVLDDLSGLVVLKDAAGNEIFDYQYDTIVGQCAPGRTTRSAVDGLGGITMGFITDEKPSDTAMGSNVLTATVGSQNTGQALPVELTDFEAIADGEAVTLRWETASETNNAGFEIQQVSGAESWQALAFVNGHGTTEQAQIYTHHLDGLLSGVHRFRLKQIDYDGTFDYSPEVEVAIGVPGTYHLTAAYPNPFNPETSFSLSVARAQEVQVVVYDMTGRRVAMLYDGLFPAETARAFRFEASALPSGVYLLRVLGEQFATTQLLILTK